MYDFCFAFPYGGLLVIGGLLGYAKGSRVSLIAGTLSGCTIMGLGYWSLLTYRENGGSTNRSSVVAQAVIALALGLAMNKRYQASKKWMPAGMISLVSGLMFAFYAWTLSQ